MALSVAILVRQLSEGDKILGRIQSTASVLHLVTHEISKASLERATVPLSESASSPHGEHSAQDRVNQATNWTTAGNTSVSPSENAASSPKPPENQAEIVGETQDPIARFQAFLEKTAASAASGKSTGPPSLTQHNNSMEGPNAILHKLKIALDAFPKPRPPVAEPNSDIIQAARSVLFGPLHGKAMAHPTAIARALMQLAEHNTTGDGVVHVCGYPSGMLLAAALFPDRMVLGCEMASAKASDIMVVSGRCKLRGYAGTILYW
jgi:hypothetical protein